ncbi:MAG: phosphodiester glycosidase family protein [Gemmatimonadetes bacterium]|nr:phosphodiester glycosidase family protein [Gemmatimonadota bacterium]
MLVYDMDVRSCLGIRAAPSMVLALLVGCGGSDPSPALPEALRAAFPADSSRSERIADGLWYHYLWSASGPFALHLTEMDMDRCELALDVASARRGGDGSTHERVSSFAARHTRPVLVAVNGDFYTPEGAPLGPEVVQGEVLRGRSRPALAWRHGDAFIGTLGVEGEVVAGPDWGTGDDAVEVDVVGGFPELLDAGQRVGDLGVASNPTFAASRHPRTAVGVDPTSRRLWIVVVDGRQGEYSTGMSLPELTSLLEALGATEGLNLDGGGSSAMVIGGRMVSRPSDPGGERPVVNALLVVRDSTGCR